MAAPAPTRTGPSPLAGLHGDTYRQVGAMVHGYRVATLYCIGRLVLAATVVALTGPGRQPKG